MMMMMMMMMMMNVDFNYYLQVHLLWFCEEARQKILCFFFLSFPKFLSPVSPSLFFVSRSLVEKKKEEGANFCSKARRKYRQNTRSRFTRCISTAILLQKRVFLRD